MDDLYIIQLLFEAIYSIGDNNVSIGCEAWSSNNPAIDMEWNSGVRWHFIGKYDKRCIYPMASDKNRIHMEVIGTMEIDFIIVYSC